MIATKTLQSSGTGGQEWRGGVEEEEDGKPDESRSGAPG